MAIHEKGIKNRGGAERTRKYSPYPKIKMDVVIATSALLVIPNCSETWAAAGAIIDEETGLINVKDDTTMVAAHFWRYGQLEYYVRLLPFGQKEVARPTFSDSLDPQGCPSPPTIHRRRMSLR